MTRALSYVEIDVPAWTQTSPDSPETETTLRFAVDTDYLPNSIPAIASIKNISIESATISMGIDLGQRANVTVTFRDHRHQFDGESFDSGTFWGKFRARYGLTLSGNPFRLIRGTLGQALEEMETRHFIIHSTEGPNNEGDFQIIAKDIFTFITGDKAQAPVLSNGLFVGTSLGALILEPAGIASEYPTIPGTSPPYGYMAIGGSEIFRFETPAGDVFPVTGAQFNTASTTHQAGERAQLCLYYQEADPADIIYDLLVNYANIDPDFIPLSDWQAETAAYLPGVTYTALIPDPRAVDGLLSELIEQASLALWWDDLSQLIRLQVLQPIPTTIDTYDETKILRGTLEVVEQPEKRLSDVQVYFSKFNPLLNDDEINNYARLQRVHDELAITEYGSESIKRILSRWIPADGATTAETLANKQLGRFRDPPRAVRFHLMRDASTDPQLGGGYQLGGTPFQTMTGAADLIPIQVTRLTPYGDHYEVEGEEMLWTPFGSDIDPVIRTITISANTNDIVLRDLHDASYGTPASGDTVNCIIQSGIIVGATNNTHIAFDVGTWPGGVTINVIVNGRIQGCGGPGGAGASGSWNQLPLADGTPGNIGGTALYTRQAINLTSTDGQIWSGGGGGGGSGAFMPGSGNPGDPVYGGGGGGGGSGTNVGTGGAGGFGLLGGNGTAGTNGTSEAGGTGGNGGGGYVNAGGNGGGPGLAGTAGVTFNSAGGAGGAAGIAIDGDSFVTDIGAVGDIRGSQVN